MSDDTEAQAQRYRRAREVLEGAGWLFDDYVNAKMADVLRTPPEDVQGRERLVTAARVAAQLKMGLLASIEEYENDEKMRERREQFKERQHGRRAEQHTQH